MAIKEDKESEIQVFPNVRLISNLEEVNGTTAEIDLEYNNMVPEQELKEIGVVWSEYPEPNIYAYPKGGIMSTGLNDFLTPSEGVEICYRRFKTRQDLLYKRLGSNQ